MNDRQLVSFIKIVETGSFSKAAKDSFISVPAMAQAKFNNSMLVFHSHWKNCYSHILKVLPSDIRAGSVGAAMRKEDRERMKNLVAELEKAV